ncbi:MAG: hypothetical protein K6E29_08185, partial [Cyanobacteria bacterium RUI128]|nr:hypothetical protein [Cyanobacteria bacterium RUI128]
MGMSSSQARLLNLTARMHQIEYKAAKLEAQKLQMANESRRVYDDYLNALDATKIQFKTLENDGSLKNVDATYRQLLNHGYYLEFLETNEMWGKNGRVEDGKVTITQADKDNYDIASENRDFFIALQTGRVNASGYNAADGVYEIYLASHLNALNSSNNYRLMSNVDMSSTALSSSKSLGSGKTFDGNGHSITGLDKALFTSVSSNSTIKNLSVQGNVNGKAILVKSISTNNVTISDVKISGSLSSTEYNVGALVGYISGSGVKIERCSSSANVYSTNNTVGGMIGYSIGSNLQVSDCSVSGSVQGRQSVGGFIASFSSGTITNCSTASTATVYSTFYDTSSYFGSVSNAGGFAGVINGTATISNCEARGNVVAESMICGGFIGVTSSENNSISNCNAYGNVYGNVNNVWAAETNSNQCGGFMSAVNGGVITNCNAFGEAQANLTAAGTDDCKGFANSDMSGSHDSHISKVVNCYAASSKPFIKTDHFLDECTQSPTPVANTITVAAPNVSTTVTVSDTGSFGQMFDMIASGNYVIGISSDPTNGHEDDPVWLTNMINAGYLFIYKQDREGNYYQTSVSTDTGLQEVDNEAYLRKAEAKYEADMRKIDMKDRKFDTDLAALDAERNAIKAEMEILKTVAKDNVERTFKLFS